MQNTKHEIITYLMNKHMDSDMKNIQQFSANVLSSDLNISRSLASQYLNKFVKEGTLIKIASRPVCFLHRKTIEKQFQMELSTTVFYSVEEFIEILSQGTCIKKNFMKMIGYDASLRNAIDQVKAAVKYPNHGLPVILYGEKGVGKSLLCREMYEYAMDQHILNEQACLCKLKVLQEEQHVWEQLVGTDLKKGLLEGSKGGIVCIQKAQRLSLDDQQRLTKLIEEGSFTHLDSNRKIEVKAQLVLSVDEDYQKCLDYDLIQCFPVICHLPDVEDRYIDEKEELLVSLFKKHAIRLNKRIFVSKKMIHILVMKKYKGNIDELINVIEDICARANLSLQDEPNLYVKMYHLPETILMELNQDEHYHEESIDYIDILAYKKSQESTKLIDLFDTILDRFLLKEHSLPSAIKSSVADLTQYFTSLSYNELLTAHQSKAMEQTISYVLNKVLTSYNMSIPFHCSPLFAYYMYLLQSMNTTLRKWKKDRQSDIKKILSLLEQQYPSGRVVAEKINYSMECNLEYEFDDMNKVILMINLIYYNDATSKSKYLSIIIAHGYATASSMAKAVNTLLGSYVFDAFDMPLDTSMLDIVERLKRYIDRYTIKNDILLLVDMGSLETINEHLHLITNKNIGMINNVSTRLALEIGESVLSGMDMKSVLQHAAKHSTSTYSFVENKTLKDLVIFISDNGIKMANRMKDLFISSLPKMIDLEVISLSIENLKNTEYMKELEKEYHILFISGICSSIDAPDRFVSLEEMITNDSLEYIQIHLNKYLSIEEIDVFSKNLLHNFSLENALNSLSILDAKKLLDFVEEAVQQMQVQLGHQLYGNTIAGLYIHMCCMIERLVTKEPIQNREGLAIFEEHHQRFIDIVKKCFAKIGNHYGVEISLSEISYLYDYIEEDKQQSSEIEGDF